MLYKKSKIFADIRSFNFPEKIKVVNVHTKGGQKGESFEYGNCHTQYTLFIHTHPYPWGPRGASLGDKGTTFPNLIFATK